MTGAFQVGVVFDGPGSDPAVRAGAVEGWRDPVQWREAVRQAENAGIGFAVLADRGLGAADSAENGVPRPDPAELAAHLAAVTDRIGLVVRTPATHAEPFHLSNRISSLDRASRGRAGWWVTLERSRERARAYGHPDAPSLPQVEREALEVVTAVRRLWDSWEDGALLADAATGRFLDRDRIHYVDHAGEFFTIRGPALLPRPIQGQPPILIRAGGLPEIAADALIVGRPDAAAAITVPQVAGSDPAQRTLAEVGVDLRSGPPAAAALVELLRSLAGQVDGVVLTPADTTLDLRALAAAVLPPLIADRTVRPPLPGGTLRELFGLPRPVSRYAEPTETTT